MRAAYWTVPVFVVPFSTISFITVVTFTRCVAMSIPPSSATKCKSPSALSLPRRGLCGMTTISSSHAADKQVSSLSSSARCMYDGLSNYQYNSPTITWQAPTVKIFQSSNWKIWLHLSQIKLCCHLRISRLYSFICS